MKILTYTVVTVVCCDGDFVLTLYIGIDNMTIIIIIIIYDIGHWLEKSINQLKG